MTSTTPSEKKPAGIISPDRLASMLDVSAVRANSDRDDVCSAALIAGKYHCCAAFSLPAFTPVMAELLQEFPEVTLGGTVGFPSGGDTTLAKVTAAKELVGFGCQEIDMVMNIGKMLSGLHDAVHDDILAVKQAIGNLPLKVIIECNYLSDAQICRASELVVKTGADWVKTGTGWASGGTTAMHVRLIKKTVGNAIRTKAAGGIHNLDILMELHQLGAERFGIGHQKTMMILEECVQRSGGCQ